MNQYNNNELTVNPLVGYLTVWRISCNVGKCQQFAIEILTLRMWSYFWVTYEQKASYGLVIVDLNSFIYSICSAILFALMKQSASITNNLE